MHTRIISLPIPALIPAVKLKQAAAAMKCDMNRVGAIQISTEPFIYTFRYTNVCRIANMLLSGLKAKKWTFALSGTLLLSKSGSAYKMYPSSFTTAPARFTIFPTPLPFTTEAAHKPTTSGNAIHRHQHFRTPL